MHNLDFCWLGQSGSYKIMSNWCSTANIAMSTMQDLRCFLSHDNRFVDLPQMAILTSSLHGSGDSGRSIPNTPSKSFRSKNSRSQGSIDAMLFFLCRPERQPVLSALFGSFALREAQANVTTFLVFLNKNAEHRFRGVEVKKGGVLIVRLPDILPGPRLRLLDVWEQFDSLSWSQKNDMHSYPDNNQFLPIFRTTT